MILTTFPNLKEKKMRIYIRPYTPLRLKKRSNLADKIKHLDKKTQQVILSIYDKR